jgi:hypothetical protein
MLKKAGIVFRIFGIFSCLIMGMTFLGGVAYCLLPYLVPAFALFNQTCSAAGIHYILDYAFKAVSLVVCLAMWPVAVAMEKRLSESARLVLNFILTFALILIATV